MEEVVGRVNRAVVVSEKVGKEIRKWIPKSGDEMIEMYKRYKGCLFTNTKMEEQASQYFKSVQKYLENTIQMLTNKEAKTKIEDVEKEIDEITSEES
jgi:gas vesicle protein